MSHLAFLTQDVFTFLALLSAEDIRPIGSRYLPPSALAKLNALLLVSDSLDIKHARNPQGRWRTGVRVRASERRAERVRFLHYLAESAHLVSLPAPSGNAHTGKWLKPTPATAHWLRASEALRAQILFQASFPPHPTKENDQRWRAFGLPGSHLRSPLATVSELLNLIRQAPSDEHIKITTLLKLLALPVCDDDAADYQPESTLGGLLKLLQWFQVIDCDKASCIQLTPTGAALLARPDAQVLLLPHRTRPLHWSKPRGAAVPNLVASLDADLPILWELGEYAVSLATLASTRQVRRLYQLDAARLGRALDHGETVTHVYELLERATRDALPNAVADWLYRIGSEYGRVTLRSVTLLEVKDPNMLSELTRSKTIRQCLRRTLSPRAVVVRPSRVDVLARRLQRDYHPRLEVQTARRVVSNDHFDQPTLAHLYLSVRLTHQLADLIPATYRPPYSILLELEQTLSPRDREIVEELLNEYLDESQPRADRSTRGRGDYATPPQTFQSVSSSVESIRRALETQTPLEIVYYSPYDDETTTRVIEPLRLEYRAEIPYLIAYCRRAADERTFRVDRIRQMAPCAADTKRRRIASRK